MKPAVSVRLLAFNQEKYIARSIESVLMQRTSFEFDLVIGVDYGNDATADIVASYARKHPGMIHTILHDKNIGMVANALETLQRCTGKYIAKLDGDDWWTDPFKLQMQFDFLESHPDFTICFHNMEIRYPADNERSGLLLPKTQPLESNRMDLALNNYIPTSSVFFRNMHERLLLPWFRELPFTDWAMNIHVAQQGRIFFLPKVMGVYNAHDASVWSSMDAKAKLEVTLKAQKIIRDHYRDDEAFAGRLDLGRRQMIGRFRANEKKAGNGGVERSGENDRKGLLNGTSKQGDKKTSWSGFFQRIFRR